jgi:streptomycin 6-kinase
MFKTRIRNLFGSEGNAWLTNLPSLRESLLEKWSLIETQPVSQLSYNYLEYALSPIHGPVVLKIGFPNPELTTEINALKIYCGLEGAVRLLECDIDQGALLLERIRPGHNLASLSDDQKATRIAAESMIAIRQSDLDRKEFPTMEKWCLGFSRYSESFEGEGGPLPAVLYRKASGLVGELLSSPEDHYLLHGDLHHGNLLSREDGRWIAIDPKGVIGEFAFEMGPYLFNPYPEFIHQPNLEDLTIRRLRILEDITGLDFHRMTAWSFCRGVQVTSTSEVAKTRIIGSHYSTVTDLARLRG